MAFAGRTVIVTGAGRGIGRELAVRYAEKGANVVIAEVDEAQGEAVARHIREQGQVALFDTVEVGGSIPLLPTITEKIRVVTRFFAFYRVLSKKDRNKTLAPP